MSAYERVVEAIQQEHRVLGHVVEMLQRTLQEIGAEHMEPDFNLLAAILYYIDDFPERLHHPKEDEHLFKALREHSSQFDAELDDLHAEHVLDAKMVQELHAALVHCVAGAYGSHQTLVARVNAYATMLREHMRKEESLLAQAADVLTESQWQAILSAFASNEDPLLANNVRSEFRKLYQRIQNRLPRKLRYPGH
jgi:hemerythrin-like domain-containing protein